ncbi:YjdF family protein [Nonomuraea sp. FMUSA5-5]|uniref:YjdF family protein n=1 Tax=Nonomuraea composti TaxID=2720023 RepID=A0ABX1B5A0_9ACTN|nr:YjdF family protein [Nonomuraea sp. FMUSA5-5]
MITLSIFFDGGFWVGVLERAEDDQVRAVRFVLGPEPTGPELYDYLLRHGVALLERSESAPPVPAGERATGRANPKRAAKLAARAAARLPTRGTAAQEGMRLELEQHKSQARADRRARLREQAEHKREVARRKRIERRRDR